MTDETIRIGSSAVLSGPAAELGLRYHAGAKAYFDEVNRAGGINGRRIVETLLDDGYEPTRAALNTRKLVFDEQVFALFGYVGTPSSNAALPIVASAKIPFIGAYTGADSLRTPLNPEVFNIRASYREEARTIAQAMRSGGMHTVNILYQYDAFGESGRVAMQSAAAEAHLSVGASASVDRNSRKVQAAIQLLIRATPADAILLVSTYDTCATFIKQAREAGYRGRFYTLSFTGLAPLRQALNGKMQRVTVAQVVPDPNHDAMPVVSDYMRSMRGDKQMVFDMISLEGYLSARVLVEGLRHAGTPLTRESLRHGLESLRDLDVGGFHVRYGADMHDGSHWVGLSKD